MIKPTRTPQPLTDTERHLVEAWTTWQTASAAAEQASARVTTVLRAAYFGRYLSQRRAAKLLGISVSAVRERLGLRTKRQKPQNTGPRTQENAG